MPYSVEVSELAEHQFDTILGYLAYERHNTQAVNAVMDDYDYAVGQLEKMADSFGF